ncbi:hypothetical protein E4U21_006120 [Claviceps maximensis]|nr:hypothetical protein E4U21_006120 [Claviceps maximensis]
MPALCMTKQSAGQLWATSHSSSTASQERSEHLTEQQPGGRTSGKNINAVHGARFLTCHHSDWHGLEERPWKETDSASAQRVKDLPEKT